MKSNNVSQALQYAQDVVEGRIVAGRLIKLAAQRFIDDLARTDLYFDEKKVEKCLKFINTLRHSTDRFSGKHFILAHWQVFIVANLIGFYCSDGRRRYNSAFICMSRKQGKTALVAALMLWFLLEVDGSEVIFAANSKEQSKIGFDMCSAFVDTVDPKHTLLLPYRDRIMYSAKKSKLRCIAADDKRLDGFNASAAVWDEGHASKDLSVLNVIKSSMAMRENPMLISISTVGFDSHSPFRTMYNTASDILHGLKLDDRQFIAIYSLDEEDIIDYENENNFEKFAPNIDITVSRQFIKDEINSIKNNITLKVPVLTKTLNVWCDSSTTWIDSAIIQRLTDNLDMNDFEDNLCYIGLDLAATSDLAALTAMFEREGIFYFFTKYYLPSDTVAKHPNRELYQKFIAEKNLIKTPGNVTDYDEIINDVMKISQKYPIAVCSFDQWNSTMLNIKLSENGINMQPYSQSIQSMNKPTRALERLILSGKVRFDNNEITRWCFANSVPKYDWNENIKITKDSADNKIDGVISTIMALGGYLNTPHYNNEII